MSKNIYGFRGVDLTDDIGLEPFAAALAEMAGSAGIPDEALEEAIEAELDSILFEPEDEATDKEAPKGDFIVTPEGIIGIDPFQD